MVGLGKTLGFGGLTNFVDPRRNMLLGLSAGFLSGDLGNVPRYAMEGKQADDAYAAQQKAEAERQQQLNQTVEWARTNFPDQLANVPEHLVGDMAVDLWKQQFMPQGGGSDATFGLTPIYGVGADGQPTIAQLSNQGGIQPIQMPEGFQVAKDPIKMDAGTHWVLLDPVTRQQIGIIPKNGDVPTGFQQAGDGSIAPMPGGPQAFERNNEVTAAQSRVRLLDERTDHVIGKVDQAVSQVNFGTAGLPGAALGGVPGLPAYDLRRTVDTIKANIGFSELQQMRENSPTGGALGQVAVQELDMLQAVLSSLDANQSQEQLVANLAEIRRLLERQKMFRQETLKERYGGVAPSAPAGGSDIDSILDGYGL